MTTVRAVAWREVRRQLTSPASWLIVGVFALAAGVFVTTLNAFLVQIGLAALLLLPLITAPAYTRERGVINREVVLATFAGARAVYAVMLLASMALVATLFVYGAPEWGPTSAAIWGCG
jgi:hypothetical protein